MRSIVRLALTLMVALATTLFIASGARAQTFPKFTGLVVDDAHILAPEQLAALDAKLTTIQKTTGHQLVVATIGDLQGTPIEDYSYQLGRAWNVGDKVRKDGLVLVVAPKDRKIWISVAGGLQGTVTDAVTSVIINTQITPKFKAGDYAGGINAGIDQLSALVQLPPEEAQKVAAQAAAQAHQRQASQPHIGFGTIMFLVVVFFFFVLPMLRAMRGSGRRYGPGGVAVYPPGSGFGGGFLGGLAGNLAANAIARELGGGGRGGSWGGGSDWGGGDGGGFGGGGGGGGGGGFDGGGAGGSW